MLAMRSELELINMVVSLRMQGCFTLCLTQAYIHTYICLIIIILKSHT